MSPSGATWHVPVPAHPQFVPWQWPRQAGATPPHPADPSHLSLPVTGARNHGVDHSRDSLREVVSGCSRVRAHAVAGSGKAKRTRGVIVGSKAVRRAGPRSLTALDPGGRGRSMGEMRWPEEADWLSNELGSGSTSLALLPIHEHKYLRPLKPKKHLMTKSGQL